MLSKRVHPSTIVALGALGLVLGLVLPASSDEAAADWAVNMTAIEACSCPMFCPCYFNLSPAGHHSEHGEEHFCRFNMAWQVNSGHAGAVDLAGARFWIGGDLGAEFGDGVMDWARVHFDPSVTAEQRGGIATMLGSLFPVTWNDFAVGEDAVVEWTAAGDSAMAKLGDGHAEVTLTRPPGRNTEAAVVIQNLKYWGAPRNDGFVLMPHTVEAYRLGEKAFEYNGGNGFMITVDLSSADVMAAAASTAP